MENPEEVLQALDEFQKMRPSEIPRELEDYLCWVARTGDPVYQWSLVKALFREKLMRVMTEFYENCPTLDLTPCPNVEQFNYDTMKSILLDRLESFVNAPFTVQRICELLTTPRKEYNRIDKFMRAIEKNILVVSTREPGPYGRRSENGDGLVNGSLEDETSHHGQGSNEVEMENWVKDCTATAATPVHAAGQSEDMSVENGLNSPSKTIFGKDRVEHHMSAMDTTTSSFVTSSSDFQVATVMPPQVPAHEATTVQNLTTANHEAAAIVGDVSDVIMNEDTSSQPSLELESSDDNDSSDSKKLQTTFQAKDFTLDESSKPKTYSEALKSAKPEESTESPESTEPIKEEEPLIQSTYSSENESTGDSQSSEKSDNADPHSIVSEAEQADKKLVTEPESTEKSEPESTNTCEGSFSAITSTMEADKETSKATIAESPVKDAEDSCDSATIDESKAEPSTTETLPEVTDSTENSVKETSLEPAVVVAVTSEASIEVSKPIIEEPVLESADSSDSAKPTSSELTIETTEDEAAKAPKTIVPDPIPVIEDPKDAATEPTTTTSTNVNEVVDEPKEDAAVKNGLAESPVEKASEPQDSSMVVSSDPVASKVAAAAAAATTPVTTTTTSTESMDVDSSDAAAQQQPQLQQDEPMDQEAASAAAAETMSS